MQSQLLTPASALFHASLGSGRTLRETVLESSPVLALLNQSFISSWSLVKELENMQVSREAALLLNHPVNTSAHNSLQMHFAIPTG